MSKMYMRITTAGGAIAPTRAHPNDAGLDLYAPYALTLAPGQRETIDTGISIELPPYTFGRITGRSSLASKYGIEVFPGTVDEGYRGRIGITLRNSSIVPYQIQAGDRIAQLIVIPCVYVEPVVVESLSRTKRGDGGFGSTGR